MKTKPLGILALAFLLFALFGCARSAAQPGTPTAITVSPSNSSLSTATLSPVTTRTVTSQKTTIPALTATSTPIPPTRTPAPLSQSGPWILLSQQQMISLNQPYPRAIMTAVFTNADGSAWEPVNLPPGLPELDAWTNMIDPKGPFIAFMNFLNSYPNQPSCDENDPLTNTEYAEYMEFAYRLYILKLPENKVVQNIPLLGPQAIEEINKENCEFTEQDRLETPPVFGVTKDIYNLSWSPDGRYLAYAAAPEGKGADIYLYDTDTDTTRRLTTRQNNPNILSWSPDSQTIIYSGVSKMDVKYQRVLESSGLYAVPISGPDRLLFKPSHVPRKILWLSNKEFAIEDSFCDYDPQMFCNTYLRLVDLSKNSAQLFYSSQDGGVGDGIFYVSDPTNHQLFFINPPISVIKQGLLPEPKKKPEEGQKTLEGIYQFDFQTRTLRPIYEGEAGYPEWDMHENALIFYTGDLNLSIVHALILRFTPGQGFTIEKRDNPPAFSPDGNWKLINNSGNVFIQDAGGTNIQKLDKGADCGWSPDSSVYVKLIQESGDQPEIQVMVYGKANNWQPIIAQKITEVGDWWCEWITP